MPSGFRDRSLETRISVGGNLSRLHEQLADVCATLGNAIPLWTQGAGGNVSVKEGNTLWIKASGFRLSEVTASGGFVGVHMDEARIRLRRLENVSSAEKEEGYAKVLRDCAQDGNARPPSMESGLHVALQKKWVAHVHSLPALLMAQARKLETKVFSSYAFLPPLLPGWQLSQAVIEHKTTSLLFLQNHGLILQSDSKEELLALVGDWRTTEAEFCRNKKLVNVVSPEWREKVNATACAFKKFFPDAWVLEDRILRATRPTSRSSEERTLLPSSWSTDRDASEVWSAIVLLWLDCPTLEEYPAMLGEQLRTLPTEIARLGSRR